MFTLRMRQDRLLYATTYQPNNSIMCAYLSSDQDIVDGDAMNLVNYYENISKWFGKLNAIV